MKTSTVRNISNCSIVIIGGGISGLLASILTGAPVFEKNAYPGGLLSSYCINPLTGEKKHCKKKFESYALFEVGGGHWIWGLEKNEYAHRIFSEFSPFKRYTRKSSVYLVDYDLFVPYPLQYHIKYLPKDIRDAALEDLINNRKKAKQNISNSTITFNSYLLTTFGETLYDLFFKPYNDQYTDGLMDEIAPPRKMKTPNDIDIIMLGAQKQLTINKIGYNYTFYYPTIGLGPLMWQLYKNARCYLNSEVTEIDTNRNEIIINDLLKVRYQKIYAAIPLLKLLELCGEDTSNHDPFVSVFVINVIAKKSRRTPKDHWVYLSKTKTRFHRIGYYSNVDKMFLPKKWRKGNYVSAYIEKTFKFGAVPSNFCKEAERIITEAVELELINDPQTYDTNFVEIAYTWRAVGSKWIENSIELLSKKNVIPIGRYATWGLVEGVIESVIDVINKVKNSPSKTPAHLYF